MTAPATSANTVRRLPALKPAPLRPGDRVALVAPASRPQSAAAVKRSMQLVEELGFVPVPGDSVLKVHGYMAGRDEERLRDLNRFLNDESVRALFCLAGGFGTLPLLDQVDYRAAAAQPKIVMGCDDNTCLINALTSRTGLVTLHGPNLEDVSSRFTFERLRQTLTSSEAPPPLTVDDLPPDELRFRPYSPVAGSAEGFLAGGNLTAFVSLMGTPYEPHTTGALLFFEDKNEQYGILDRWFTTLYIAGKIERSSGIAFGAFENCGLKGSANMLSIEDIFGDRLVELGKISAFGLPFGQRKDTSIVPLNIMARLDAAVGGLEFAEPALSTG